MTPRADVIDSWKGRRIAVVGDVMLDRYISGKVPRISPEAPVPVVFVEDEDLRVGGAANVAANIAALGGRPTLVGVIGQDEAGRLLKRKIREGGVPVAGLRTDPGRPTVQKTRIVARHQQLVRVDREAAGPVEGEVEERLCRALQACRGRVDAVVLSDYGKGLLTPDVIRAACGLDAEVLVDPKGRDFQRYRGAQIVTPNAREAEEASGVNTSSLEGCRDAARALMRSGRFQSVVLTRGSEGVYYRTRGGAEGSVPTRAHSVFDVTGAGDTVISVLALARAAGHSLPECIEVANAAAGLVVQRFGAAVVTPGELADALLGGSLTATKVTTLAGAEAQARRLRAEGRRLVLTNGCFDLLHVGHVESLEFARSHGDFLCVAINDDASVRRMKGPERPVQSLRARLRVLAALACVDLVFPFSEDTPEQVVKAITPHVLVKGADWAGRGVVGQDWVEQHGGRVVLAPLQENHSTSRLIERIRNLRN